MTLNILKQPFVRLSYSQGATTYFTDGNSNYYKLVATSASNATFSQITTTPTDGNVIPASATVFVTFQDNSTVIINNMNFYGKPVNSGSEPTIKLLSGSLPNQSSDQEYNIGDVVLAIDVYNPSDPQYELAICTDINEVEDSGETTYVYTWTTLLPDSAPSVGNVVKVVSSLPNSDSDGLYNFGDVVALVSTYLDSGRPVFSEFKMYVLSGVNQYYDCGIQRTYYTWTEVYTYPQTATTNSSFS